MAKRWKRDREEMDLWDMLFAERLKSQKMPFRKIRIEQSLSDTARQMKIVKCRTAGKTEMHSYPDFKFLVVDINTTSKGDTLSNNLQNAVDLSFQAIEPLELNFKKEISKKESSKRVEKIAPRFKAAKEVLTQDERKRISID